MGIHGSYYSNYESYILLFFVFDCVTRTREEEEGRIFVLLFPFDSVYCRYSPVCVMYHGTLREGRARGWYKLGGSIYA